MDIFGTYTITQTDINSNGGGNGLIENTATVDCTQLEPKSHSAEVPVKKISAYAIDKIDYRCCRKRPRQE